MKIKDFKSTVMTFADPGSEIFFDHTRIMISVNDNMIHANIATRSGDVYVDEGGEQEPASKWILTRLARLPLLASRLLESVPPIDHFVYPSGSWLPAPKEGSKESEILTDNALTTMQKAIHKRSPLETTALYITSDAGEGKTSLINELARMQANHFKDNKSDWLLVPIPLGGRHFLRFDDITVGALQNRYRFPYLYYGSFLAMVKMGVIVPAFDGFEEMFVESSSGEALSAMGILVNSLDSHGAIVVAARKAYFEFENLGMQVKLFDTIRTHSVGFGKVKLARWKKPQFMEYSRKRGITNPEKVYQRVSEHLKDDHPLLTRAVLVKRLLDLVEQSHSLDNFLKQLKTSGANFFSLFVFKLIEREATEKWIDRSGNQEVGTPLLTVDEHCELLSQIALTMWESRVDYMTRDNLEFVSDYFCEVAQKDAYHVQQIRERIRGHAMLVPSRNATQAVEFNHDAFRLFFVGEGIARQIQPLNDRAKAETLGYFRRGILPEQAQHALTLAVMQNWPLIQRDVVVFLLKIIHIDSQVSYAHENCGNIIIQLLNGMDGMNVEVSNVSFSADALCGKKLLNIIFKDCYFSPSCLESTTLEQCRFIKCKFSQLRIFESSKISDVTFDHCTVDGLKLIHEKREIWDPGHVQTNLQQRGIIYEGSMLKPSTPHENIDESSDDDIRDMKKIVRYFTRSTHISERVMLMKLGTSRGQPFIENSLPILLKNRILEEITHTGAGTQRRFRFGVSLQKINVAIAASQGSFSTFLAKF